MISAKEAALLTQNPLRINEAPLMKCSWAIESAILKHKRSADVFGGVFGGVRVSPPKPSYLRIVKTLEGKGYAVKPIGGFFRPGIRIGW